jgi:GMP reductase
MENGVLSFMVCPPFAQKTHSDGIKSYRASEGKVTEVPYKGPVDDVIKEILGGIRSCCTYIGAQSIKDMNKCSQFCLVNKIQ